MPKSIESSTSEHPSSMLPSSSRFVPCEIVFTIFEKLPKRINLDELHSSDVAALKTKDPFMYYSIPSVKNAAVLQRDCDRANIDSPINFSGPVCKMQNQVGENEPAPRAVTRKSRVSFECHASLLLEDVVNDSMKAVDSEEEDSSFDNFLYILQESQKRKERLSRTVLYDS